LYEKVKKEELRRCGIKAVRNRYRIDSISIFAILTNTIRYRYEIDASGIEAEPAIAYVLLPSFSDTKLLSANKVFTLIRPNLLSGLCQFHHKRKPL
jgi:hypothetical protein